MKNLILLIVALITAASAYGWDEQSCASMHRLTVTLNVGAIGHSGEVRVDLSSVDFPAEYIFSSNGEDVRVFAADNVTPVPLAITIWNTATKDATLYLRPPTLSANTSYPFNIYFGDSSLPAASDIATALPDAGLLLHSRASLDDPTNVSDARTFFAASTVDYYNDVLASMSGVTNASLTGGVNADFAWCVSTVLEVTPATQGIWEFRYGADFGRGGHLFLNGQQLEEAWNADLWWNFDWNNTAMTLEGGINLSAGIHQFEALGFEACCDGAVGWEAKPPGGVWQDFNTTNFPIHAAQCINTTLTVTTSAPESCSKTLNADKTVAVVSDPVANADPYALPGSVTVYRISVSNPGGPVDSSSIVLTDALPTRM